MLSVILAGIAGLDAGVITGFAASRVSRTSREELFCGAASESCLKSASLLDDRLDRQLLAVPYNTQRVARYISKALRFLIQHSFVEKGLAVQLQKLREGQQATKFSTEVRLVS